MSEPFILGAVSNCWAALLRNSSLEAECRRGLTLGFRYVELRQRALGDAEEPAAGDERPWPIPERLAELARAVPDLDFNLAVEAPFMTAITPPDDPYLRRCAEAARALGGPAVLRLVDVSPAPALLNDEQVQELAQGVAALAREFTTLGVRLALENSKQPVGMLQALVRSAKAALPPDVPAPQICWDSHNQVSQGFTPEDPSGTARELPLEDLFEFHFKQVRNGELQTDVGDGELDWRVILTTLRQRGYHGPALFEIPPGPDVWERLERSTAYLRPLLAQG